MVRKPFTLPFEKLPASIPIFPLPGAVLMPRAQLPLNIFEPRYLNLVADSLGDRRIFGMVQPDPTAVRPESDAVFRTGCVGRITSFGETDDGRFLIVLTGVCRFDITEELSTIRGYRRVSVDWGRFGVDYEAARLEKGARERLMRLLRVFSNAERIHISWDDLAKLDDAAFVNLLITHLPLEVNDKQALLEAVTLAERCQVLTALLDISVARQDGLSDSRH